MLYGLLINEIGYRDTLEEKTWVFADGYIPAYGTGPEPELTSHEVACMLNTSLDDAHLEVTLYLENRDPLGPYHSTVAAQRTVHLRFNNLRTLYRYYEV